MEIIVSHAGADFDGYASMVAAQRLYPEALLVTLGPPAPWVREFLSLHQSQFPITPYKEIDPGTLSRVIVVDTSNPSRLGPLRMLVQRGAVEVHVYDHHAPRSESIQGEVSVIRPLGAAVTVVLQEVRLQQPDTRLSVPEATLFLLAISEETGSFTFPSTTPDDFAMSAWLLEQGASLAVVAEVTQRGLTPAQLQLRDELLRGARRVEHHGADVLLMALRLPRFVGEVNEIVARLLVSEAADVAAAAVAVGSRCFLVARSRAPRFNLLPAIHALGGGGHPCAASATLDSSDPDQVLDKFLAELSWQPEPAQTVGHHMSREVQTTPARFSVQEAAARMQASGRTATVVVNDEGTPVGMLARSDLDKALAHNLAEAPAATVMTQPLLSVTPQTELDAARELLIRHDVGRLPVLQDGRLVGIVSRTDVLRQVYTDRSQADIRETQTGLTELLLKLPWEWLELLKEAGERARACGVEVYAVGGFVRDLLLQRLHEAEWDLDLCVEGSVDEFLDLMQRDLGGTVHRHKRFETATLVLPSGQKIDVARARQETYCRPAALPDVQSSNLKQDLFRRDFTINALAVRLTAGSFGELVDFFGGLGDLRGGSVRVLHNYSFIDDPTRILRAVRIEQRLGFRIRGTTEHLLRSALSQRILLLAGPDRLRDELLLCLSEERAVAVLERLEKLRVLHNLHPRLHLDPRTLEVLKATDEALRLLQPRLPELQPWRARVRALLHRWPLDQVQELLTQFRIPLPPPARAQNLPATLWSLHRNKLPPSQVVELLQPLTADEIAVLWALAARGNLDQLRIEQRIEHYLDVLRHVRPLLDGGEILRAGVARGPQVARWKARAFATQLDRGWTSDDLAEARVWLAGELDAPQSLEC